MFSENSPRKIKNETSTKTMKYIPTKEKKGSFSIDASLAVIIILTMSILFYYLLQNIFISLHNLDARQKTVSLIIFSNEIVRREGAYKTNTETVSNMISIEEMNSYKTYLNSLKSTDYGFKWIEITISVKGRNDPIFVYNKTFENTGNPSNVFCINRLVVVRNSGALEDGVLRVCVI